VSDVEVGGDGVTQKPEIGEPGWRPTEVHPAADAFPMLPDDELTALAGDIKANGLIHPIVIDADGILIDGRNRLRACELANVEPTFTALNGHDARAFIVSANINRRNLKKGQQIMALAIIYPIPEKGGRGKTVNFLSSFENVASAKVMLSHARSVLRHSEELANDVLADRTPLDVALKKVEAARQQSTSVEAQMANLRSSAPDVAALIDDERLTLEAGMAELKQRQQRIRQCVDAGRDAASRFSGLASYVTVIETAMNVSDADLALIGMNRKTLDLFDDLTDQDVDELLIAARTLKRLKAAARRG
jgi:ParB-like nuclease domain